MYKLSKIAITAITAFAALTFFPAASAFAAPAAATASPSLTNLQLDPNTNTNVSAITVTVPTEVTMQAAYINISGASWTGISDVQAVLDTNFATSSTPSNCGSSQIQIGTANSKTGQVCSISTRNPSAARAEFEPVPYSNPGTVTFLIPAGALTFYDPAPTGGYKLDVVFNYSNTASTSIPVTLLGLTPAATPSPSATPSASAAPSQTPSASGSGQQPEALANTGLSAGTFLTLTAPLVFILTGVGLIIMKRTRSTL